MSEPPQTIETPRLKLRIPILQDAAAILEQYAQDEKVTKYLTWRSHYKVEITLKYLQKCLDELTAKTAFYWVIILKQENRTIGMIRL